LHSPRCKLQATARPPAWPSCRSEELQHDGCGVSGLIKTDYVEPVDEKKADR